MSLVEITRLADPKFDLGVSFDKTIAEYALPYTLREYQKEGVKFFSGNHNALLADEMGLGKTVQTIVALRILFEHNVSARVLIVTPRALTHNWKHEFSVWAPNFSVRIVHGNQNNRSACYLLPFPVIIATYEQIRADRALLDYNKKFDVVVLDEAQRIKSPSSSTSIACTTIPRLRSWTLSGTPLENVTEDLVSVFSFLQPGLLLPEMSAKEMRELMSPYFLRRTKQEVLPELPPIIEQEMRLGLSGQQRDSYHTLWNDRRNSGIGDKGASGSASLGLITKLKQLCNYDPDSGESVKLEATKVILDNLLRENDKVIIFSQFVETLRWLGSQLTEYESEMYSGQMADDERENSLDRFRNLPGFRLLLMSLRAGGVGLNLQEASTVILFDRWWNPAVEKQAIHRAHRFGRERPLHVIKFLVSDSIEERIDDVIAEKQDLFDTYIDFDSNKFKGPFDAKVLSRLLV